VHDRQDPPHRLGCNAEEMASIGELVIANQAHIRLMHQRGGIESVTRFLATKLCSGKMAEFVIDERQQSLGGRWFAVPNLIQNPRYIIHDDEIVLLGGGACIDVQLHGDLSSR